MKIYVVGSSKNKFLPLNNIRQKFIIDVKHNEDNIDFLNPWYCELTGLYHLWKNVNDDIVGLEHYRRYFVNNKNKILSESEVKQLLNNCDVICKKYYYKSKLKGYGLFNSNNWLGILNYYFKLIATENLEFSIYLKNKLKTNYLAQCNMFIGKKEIIDKYCEFLFSVLFKFNAKDFFNIKRIIGYLAEITFGAWLEFNNYKIYFNKVQVYG